MGICGDVVHDWFNRRDYPTAYVPYAQSPTGNFGLAVRAAGDPAALSSAARAAVRAVDASQPVYDVMTLRAALGERTLGLQYIAAVMGVLGALALVLAAGGVYGVMAYMVAQRAHEIGVRIALGATRADVMKLTVSHTVRLAAVWRRARDHALGSAGPRDRVGAARHGVGRRPHRGRAGRRAVFFGARRRLHPGTPRGVDRSDLHAAR